MSLPYDLANGCNGVKVFFDRIAAPAEFAEHSTENIEVAIPFENATGPAQWHTAGGRTVTRRMHGLHTGVLPAVMLHANVNPRINGAVAQRDVCRNY